MKIKVYSGVAGIFLIFLILLVLVVLAIITLPIFLILIAILGIYVIIRYKLKSFFKKIWYKLSRKKIKIVDASTNGEVKIHFPKRINIEGGNEASIITGKKSLNYLECLDEDSKTFAHYLKNIGAEFKEEGIYFRGLKIHPIYKKSYPLNEIIKLNYPDNIDAVILGLKGEPYEPKFIYLIPKEFLKERMNISELKKFELV